MVRGTLFYAWWYKRVSGCGGKNVCVCYPGYNLGGPSGTLGYSTYKTTLNTRTPKTTPPIAPATTPITRGSGLATNLLTVFLKALKVRGFCLKFAAGTVVRLIISLLNTTTFNVNPITVKV